MSQAMMTKKEAKKQGLAFWDEGALVEIGLNIRRADRKGEYSDPNTYRARCLSSGTNDRVRVEVLDSEGHPRPDFPEALLPGEFFIWRLLPAREEEEKAEEKEEAKPSPPVEFIL